MKCKTCKNEGHNSRSCKMGKEPPKPEVQAPPPPPKKEPYEIKFLRDLAEEVLMSLGAGHTESVYHNAMKMGIHDEGMPFETERDLPISFRGRYVGTVRADLIINKKLVIELKQSATGSDTIVDDATEQCKCYMKETKATTGVVIVFPKRESGTLAFKWWSTVEEEEEEEEEEE
jgi:hypothetical protein